MCKQTHMQKETTAKELPTLEHPEGDQLPIKEQPTEEPPMQKKEEAAETSTSDEERPSEGKVAHR